MKTIVEMGAALRARQVSARELAVAALEAADRQQARLNAFLTMTPEAALARADMLDRELAQGIDRGPLHGIPIAHKDCIYTKGVRTTWGSKLFADFVPDRDAAVVRRLDEAGAISIGKTGLHELTYGMTSNNPHYGPVRNPHDPERVAGGSSGGSAVAVAAGIVPLATGTDTGGSIRIPAAFCGVVGFKPTFDRISREGCMPLGLTLDHIGPITSTAEDAALAFAAMALDSAPLPSAGWKALRIGIPANFFFDRVDPAVAAAVQESARRAASHGATLEEIPLPGFDALAVTGRIVQLAEAAAVLERYAHRREGFGPDVLSLLDQGRLIPATEYLNAQRVRQQVIQQLRSIWDRVNLLLAPATPMPAPPIGEMLVRFADGTEDVRIAGTRLTRPLNVTGWPAISLPCGRTHSGLPIGLQLIAAPHRDEFLLAAAQLWSTL